MKKVGLVVTSAFVFCMLLAAPALADYPLVQGKNGSQGAGGTAFTGSAISLWVVALAVLAVAGVTALFVSRRRAKASA